MSLLGIYGVEEYQRRLRGEEIEDDEPSAIEKSELGEPAPPDLNCPQRCGCCYNAPNCAALREHIEFSKEIPAQDDYQKHCQSGDRSQENFRKCMWCKRIVHCEILRRVMRQ